MRIPESNGLLFQVSAQVSQHPSQRTCQTLHGFLAKANNANKAMNEADKYVSKLLGLGIVPFVRMVNYSDNRLVNPLFVACDGSKLVDQNIKLKHFNVET